MRAVDVRVHGREAIGKTLRHEALRRQVVTFVKLMPTDDVKNAGVALEACGMQCYLVQQMLNPAQSAMWFFQCNATD